MCEVALSFLLFETSNPLLPSVTRGVISRQVSVLNHTSHPSPISLIWHDDSYIFQEEIGASLVRFLSYMKENIGPR